MQYCNLGHSGLQVSRIGLGTDPFGTVVDEKTSQQMVDQYLDAGGNLLDTANFYGGSFRDNNSEMAGTSERTVGKIMRGKRDQFILATKGYWTMENETYPNGVGLARANLTGAIEASLRRLDTDYIDLYHCHAWDFYTPVEETMRVLDEFVRAGKIRYVGVSNWDGWQVVKGKYTAQSLGLNGPISNQIWYSVADRTAENSIIPACRDRGVAVIAWGALAQGFLSGKYRRGTEGPRPGSNFEIMEDCESSSWKALAVERNWALLDVLADVAEQSGASIPNVAARWLLQSGHCDVALLGATRLEQLQNNLNVMNFELSDVQMSTISAVSRPCEPYPVNFLNLFCRRESEFYGGLRVRK